MAQQVCNADWRTAAWSYYRYVPAVAPAVIFCLLFLLSTGLHAFQMFKTKTWFLTALVVGCLFEFVGYAGRIASARQEPGCWTLMPFIVQSLFILVAPALFSASVYMILGRVILLTDGERHSVIRPRRLTKMFVAGDVLCFLLQCGGGGLIASGGGSTGGKNLTTIGNNTIIAGLVLQLLWFSFFVIVAGIFHRRMRLIPTAAVSQQEDGGSGAVVAVATRWESYLATLYVVSGLVMLRSVFRVVEYAEGNDGYLLSTEVFLYVFDATAMFIAVAWLHWRHPGEIGMLLRKERLVSSNRFSLPGMGPNKGGAGAVNVSRFGA